MLGYLVLIFVYLLLCLADLIEQLFKKELAVSCRDFNHALVLSCDIILKLKSNYQHAASVTFQFAATNAHNL